MNGTQPRSPYKGTRVRLKGLFADGIWKCNCEPRLPAIRFETKNGGKNHGRWFYSCQKSSPSGCGFFLWEDDAKPRERNALANNSRSEPLTQPATPRKRTPPLTYSSPNKLGRIDTQPLRQTDAYNSNDSDEGELNALADLASSTSPRKAVKTEDDSSPGSGSRAQPRRINGWSNLAHSPDSPSPLTRKISKSTAEDAMISPFETPRANRISNGYLDTPSKYSAGPLFRNPSYPMLTPSTSSFTESSPTKSIFTALGTPSSNHQSSLETDILSKLSGANISLSPEVKESLLAICRKHALQSRAFEKGRDSTRIALRKKEAELAKSGQRIQALEAELDVHKRTIRRMTGRRGSTVGSETTQATTAYGGDSDSGEEEGA